MRVFMTGGNGFIGSAVARSLVAAGHGIVCLLRESSNTERLAALPFTRAPGDVRDIASVQAGMVECDCTIHLAAPGAWDADDPAILGAVLEGGTRNVLDVAAGLPGHRVVVVSSTAAIAASTHPVVFDERTPFSVSDSKLYYAFAKHRTEDIAARAHERGVHVVVVNPAEVYGPNDVALITAGNLVDVATSTPAMVCRGGTGVVHVDDVASGIVAALARGRSGERYILSGENLTVRELAALVLELRGRRATVVTVPNAVVRLAARVAIALRLSLSFNPHVVPYATWFWFVSNAKARRELGVEFRSARETIAETLEWLVATGRLAPPVH